MKRDYLKEVLKVLGVTLVLLLIFGLIPDFNFKYKHFNLLSDILNSDTSSSSSYDTIPKAETLSLPSEEYSQMITEDTTEAEQVADATITTSPVMDSTVVIEDYSVDKRALLSFYKALQEDVKKRPVRIGVLGDSFIEADIITGKLRSLLQSEYGGTGVGFMPIVSPAAQYRKTIQQTFSGWTTYSMIHYKKADWKNFCLSGFYFTPSEDAFVSLKTNKEAPVTQATFFYINRKHTQINVSVNNQSITVHQPEPSDSLQFLSFTDKALHSVSISVGKVDGFTGIGVFMNDASGVYVDNFSVRGSSGSVLTTVDKDLSDQLSKRYPYDLIIMQHGLNVISPDMQRYPAYKKLMVNAVRHIQSCYPGVPVLMLSVGDKGSKGADGITTHPGVQRLVEVQRQVARETGIAFWDTYKAMGGQNSMVGFVNHKPPMAAKDYTHINYLGGDYIAERLYESLTKDKSHLIP